MIYWFGEEILVISLAKQLLVLGYDLLVGGKDLLVRGTDCYYACIMHIIGCGNH